MKIEFAEFQALIAKQLRLSSPSKVQMDSLIKKDLGADSLDLLQMLLRLEDDYGIQIPDESLAGFKTVGDVFEFVSRS